MTNLPYGAFSTDDAGPRTGWLTEESHRARIAFGEVTGRIEPAR